MVTSSDFWGGNMTLYYNLRNSINKECSVTNSLFLTKKKVCQIFKKLLKTRKLDHVWTQVLIFGQFFLVRFLQFQQLLYARHVVMNWCLNLFCDAREWCYITKLKKKNHKHAAISHFSFKEMSSPPLREPWPSAAPRPPTEDQQQDLQRISDPGGNPSTWARATPTYLIARENQQRPAHLHPL